MSAKAPTSNDALIAARIRARRGMAGISQERLASALGITFQQVQKYENGSNRVSVGRLVDIAAALGCQPGDLIADLPSRVARVA